MSVQSIDRAFQILHAVHQRINGVTIGDLAEKTDLNVSTVSRLVSSLEDNGAIERIGSKVVIGEQIVALASRASWTDRLASLATPHLEKLASQTQEAVGLTCIEGRDCRVFFQIPSTHHIQIRDWTGERFPLHVTSSGKLFLALQDAALVDGYLAQPLERFAAGTVVDSAEFRTQLTQIAAERVAWTDNELEDGLTSIAAPIYTTLGSFAAGLYISLPSYRVASKATLAAQVSAAAQAISAQLSTTK